LQKTDFYSEITSQFNIEKKDIRTYSSLALAFLGDGVFEIVVRTIVMAKGNRAPQKLHLDSANIVKAKSQAKISDGIMEMLTDEEKDIYRQGKNANSHTRAKNASLSDYRKATGFETLLGYLYIEGKTDRIINIVKSGINILEEENQDQ
jgi:ribonuclease III family protein